MAELTRGRARLLLVLRVLPLWLVVLGMFGPWAREDDSDGVFTAVCILSAIALTWITALVSPPDVQPPTERSRAPRQWRDNGPARWLAEVAKDFDLGRAGLTALAGNAGLPARLVLTVAWTPGFVLIWFVVFLLGLGLKLLFE